MNWGELKADIQKGLSLISDVQWEERDILRRANVAQKVIVRHSGCIINTHNATSTSGSASMAKPDLCLRMRSLTYSGKKLYNVAQDVLHIMATTGQIASPWTDISNTPTNYIDEWLTKYMLYPKPNATGDVIVEEYVESPADMVIDDNSIPFNDIKQLYDYHYLISKYVILQSLIEASMKNPALVQSVQIYNQQYNEGLAFLKVQMENKPDRIITGGLIRRGSGNTNNPIPGVTI